MGNILKLQITRIEEEPDDGDHVIHFRLFEGSPDRSSIDHDLECMGITGDCYSYIDKWFPDTNTGIIKQRADQRGCRFSVGDLLTVGADLTPMSNSDLHVQTNVFKRRLEHLIEYLKKQPKINGDVKALLLEPASLNRLLLDDLSTPNSIQEFSHYITSNPIIYAAALKRAFEILATDLTVTQAINQIKRENGYSLYKLVFTGEANEEVAWIWSKENPGDMAAYLQFSLESLADYEQVDISAGAVPMANALIKLYDCHYGVSANDYETVCLHDVREERCGQWYRNNFMKDSRFTRDKYHVISAFGPHLFEVSY